VNLVIAELPIEYEVESVGITGKNGPVDSLNGAQAMSAMKFTFPPATSV